MKTFYFTQSQRLFLLIVSCSTFIFCAGYFFSQIINFIFYSPVQFIFLIILIFDFIFSIRLFLKLKRVKESYELERRENEIQSKKFYTLLEKFNKLKGKENKIKIKA